MNRLQLPERFSCAPTTFRPVVFDRRAYPFVLGTRLQRRKPAKKLALEPNRFAAREPDRPPARAGPTDRRRGAAIRKTAWEGLNTPTITVLGKELKNPHHRVDFPSEPATSGR